MDTLFRATLIIGALINFACALQLEGLSTKKPRLTKYTMKPTTVGATLSPISTVIYRINGTSGATCILIETDALLSIQYRDKLKEDREADIFVPADAELSGDCSNEDDSSITINFKGFTLTFLFKKTPGGERWYINSIDLSYSSSNSKFEHIDRPGLNVKLSTSSSNLLFPTPVGKSYACEKEQTVVMYAQDENDKSGHLAKLYLRSLRMQSFMYKAANTWGPTFHCSATGTYRDESAPLFVGSTLAVAVLCTVSGYGLWRYFKVKKVQYGTME